MARCYFPFAGLDTPHTKMIVFLSGLSGVGKTTTAKAFVARHTQFKHVIASDVIKSAGASTYALDYAQVEYNQRILIRDFAEIRRNFPGLHILLDGHMVIETNEGQHILDDEIIDGLYVSDFVAIVDDPSRIFSARSTIGGSLLPPNELDQLQKLEVAATKRQAERTRRPFAQVRSGELEALERTLGLAR
jgi:adenylate kinase